MTLFYKPDQVANNGVRFKHKTNKLKKFEVKTVETLSGFNLYFNVNTIFLHNDAACLQVVDSQFCYCLYISHKIVYTQLIALQH